MLTVRSNISSQQNTFIFCIKVHPPISTHHKLSAYHMGPGNIKNNFSGSYFNWIICERTYFGWLPKFMLVLQMD